MSLPALAASSSVSGSPLGLRAVLSESPMLSMLLSTSDPVTRRALLRALKSTGWMIQQNWRLYFRSPSWAPLSPMTKALGGKRAGLKFLRQFLRYKALEDGMAVAIGFGKGKSRAKKFSDAYTGVGQFGLVGGSLLEADPVVTWIAEKAEFGWHGQITDKMRNMVAAKTKARSKAKNPKVGRNYYAFGRDKAFIDVPRRSVAGDFFSRIMPKVPTYFGIKFQSNLNKLLEGGAA